MPLFSRFHRISALRLRWQCKSGVIGSGHLRLWQACEFDSCISRFINTRHGRNSSLSWRSFGTPGKNKQPTPLVQECRRFASVDITRKISHNTFIEKESSLSQPFPHEYYQPYKRAVANIFSSTEFKSKKRSFIGQALWTEKMFQQFEQWLLAKRSSVDTKNCWDPLKEKWMEELTGNSMKDEKGGSKKKYKMELSCTSEFAFQAEALQSKIFTTPSNPNRSSYDDEEHSRLVSKAISRMMRFVFHQLLDYRQGGGASFIMPIVWYKLKESAVILQSSKIRLMLNVMIESMVKNDQHHHWEQTTSLELLMEELIMYHDLIGGVASENFFYQRYPAMLRYHCQRGDVNVALNLLKEIEPYQSAPFKYDHYMLVLAVLIENGHLRGSKIELFDEIASDMSDQACKITQTSAIQLNNALAKEFSNLHTNSNNNGESSVISNLVEWNPAEGVPIRDVPARSNELLACRAEIDPFTGTCDVTNMQLRNESLTQAQRNQMYKDLLELGEKVNATKELKKFSDWMDNRTGHPFTIVLDGPNVGNVKSMVETLERKGENPLVIFPARHNHYPRDFHVLKNRGNLYVAPDTIDDDLFCMLATVSDQKTACGSHSKGVCPILVTNDQFFDHRKKMWDQSLFQEWYTRHCYKHGRNKATIVKIPTNVFNRRIRCHEWSDSNDDGNDESGLRGKVWHFPVNGWGFHERFVVRIPFDPQKLQTM